MKFKIILLFLVFNFSSAMCADGYHKEAAATVAESVRCGHVTPNPNCLDCGIAASNADSLNVASAPSSEASFASNACAHTSDKNYCIECNPLNSSSHSASKDSGKITMEAAQCEQHIFENGVCITCKQPGRYDESTYTSNFAAAGSVSGGSGDVNITSGPKYKNYFIGGTVIALAFYLWKKFR